MLTGALYSLLLADCFLLRLLGNNGLGGIRVTLLNQQIENNDHSLQTALLTPPPHSLLGLLLSVLHLRGDSVQLLASLESNTHELVTGVHRDGW